MKRSVAKSRLNDLESRYRVVIESEPCEIGTQDARQKQHDLLKTIVETPGMMDCGPAVFQTLRMSHDGSHWIVEMEAVSA